MKGGKGGKKGGEPLGMASKGVKGEGKPSKGGGKSSGSRGGTPLTCAMKFLAPEILVSAIIGKGGAVISEMRTNCDARIALTDHDEFYPKTDCRVVTVQANTEDSLHEVSKSVISKVVEVAAAGAAEGKSSDSELRLRTLVPFAAAGGIIGKGGDNIKQIREASGARISIDDPIGRGPGADQVLSVSGNAAALEQVLMEVNKQIQLVNKEQWFPTWASTPGVVHVASGGGGANYWAAGGEDSYSGYGGGNWGGYGGYDSTGLGMMWDVASGLPPYVLEDERGFAMSCVVPNNLCGGMIGKGGAGTKEVQAWTGTKISFREIPDDPENRALNITGPLSNTCAAYMLMMKRYLDAEANAK